MFKEDDDKPVNPMKIDPELEKLKQEALSKKLNSYYVALHQNDVNESEDSDEGSDFSN